MRKLVPAVALALVLLATGCVGGGASPGSGSWILGTWEGDVVDTGMRIEFSADGSYEWIMADTGEVVASGTWSAESDSSPVDLKQSTGQEFVFSVLPLAVFDGEMLHITAREDYLISALVDPGAQEGNIEALMADLRDHPDVGSADFVSAEDAAQELEAAAAQPEVVVSAADTPARIDITLDDWSRQAEFIEWLEDQDDFKIIREGPDAIREPDGLRFSRAD